MKRISRIVLLMLAMGVMPFAGTIMPVSAQNTDTIRYVHPNGVYTNDGKSWETPFNRVQDAINSLHDYLNTYNLHSGSVYIAAGTYVPTESTEGAGGSMLNTSFKIYGGIHVYGGFNPDAPEAKPGDRIMSNGKKCSENWADQSGIGTVSGTEIASQWDLRYKTVLSGNHTTTPPTFAFDSIRGRYNTTFPASSFHVVWFATNGTFAGEAEQANHFRPLTDSASVDGCVISSGNASTRNTNQREHTAYGGGVYMVGNTGLRNCIIERCHATMRGGGVYTDGGGTIEFCLVEACQASGVGVYQGYGGGVCIDYGGSIGHSHITSCAARCGGGLMICHIPEEHPTTVPAIDTVNNYSPFATACVINNNTANAEGGGIYLAEGGTINHCTVTANCCTGPDVTYYGRRHGRTGGIYVRNCGMIFNSVFWGNRCDANNDIQFASVRQKTSIAGYETLCYHSAFMNHDITDWTGVRKEMVFTLEKQNMPVNGTLGNHPCFFKPTVDPTNWHRYEPANGYYGAGVVAHLRPVDYPGPRIWHLTSYSALDQKGVQANETMTGVSYWLRHAHTDYGVVSNPYEPVSTLGALVRRSDPLTYALIAPQGYEGRVGGAPIPTLFIDPNRRGVYDEDGHFVEQTKEGDSWDVPIKDLGEAISFFRQYLKDDDGGNHHYMIPALDDDGMPTGDSVRYDYVQFLVKEGTVTTVGHGNYLDRSIRTAAIRLDSHMRMYGGYPATLTGTDTHERDPLAYKSIISANITGIEGASGYQNNSAHVIAMVNVEHTIVDGFTLTGANTHNVYESSLSVRAGGGLILNNSSTPAAKRIHMVGNQLRNCVISNCTSPKGAAVYVNGEFSNTDGELSYAELLMQNCVIRNNTADYHIEDKDVESHGIITANGRAYVHIEHCTVVNNVGFPFKADSKTTVADKPIHCGHPEHYDEIFHGYIRVDNSLIFCNGDRPLDNRGDLGKVAQVMSVNEDGQDYVFGKWNMFDADLVLHKADWSQPRGFFADDYSVPIVTSHFLPSGVVSHFTTDISGVPADSLSRGNRAIFTRASNDPNYPTFVNPSRNVGHSTTGDRPLYGGTVAYDPLTTNPCVNAAHPDYYTPDLDNYDRSDVTTRDRGGAPDVGAIENSDLPAAGAVIYVTPDGAGKRDGSSWDNAIAGNTVYRLSTVPGPDLAAGDQIDPEATCDRVLDSEGNPILTTNEKYNGGWGRVWYTDKRTGATSTTTVTTTWITEKNTYAGGPKAGQTEVVQDGTTPTETTSTVINNTGKKEGGFVAGYDYDPRYPYGEISGASRSFWRANPYHNGTDWNNAKDYADRAAFITACNANGWINNTRAERYVSGLQYAVEKAAATNAEGSTEVQVWVGAGKYTDYKGYVMRNNVTVLGGFPAGKFAAPAMSERQALMSDVVSIPKSKPAANFDAVDYETVLQISDVNPNPNVENRNDSLNGDAVKYWDDDYSRSETTDTRNYAYKTRKITNTYTYSAWEDDVTSTYIYHPTFDGSSKLRDKNTGVPGHKVYGVSPAPADKDYWHFTYPTEPEYYYLEITPQNNTALHIFDYDTGEKLEDTNSRWFRSSNGSLTGEKMYHDMKNMEAGTYKLTLDMMGGYRNGSVFDITTPSNIYLHILDSDSNDLADPVLLKCRDFSNPSGTNASNVRNTAFRKTIEFTASGSGDVTIMVEVLDGTRNKGATYPKTPSGGDPNPIPWYYKYDEGTESNPKKEWGTKNPNRREFFITNLKLTKVDPSRSTYARTNQDIVENDTVVDSPRATEVTSASVYTPQNHRITLRKRVLTMPDVCVPTYGAGSVGDPADKSNGKLADALPHTDRVSTDTRTQRTAATLAKESDPNYVEYSEANWDGFTIRHGFITDEAMAHGGGAGVNMYEGAHLRNCIVVDNMSHCPRVKGGGLFCDGATSTIEGCYVLNNQSTLSNTTTVSQIQIFAGGMFMYEGTCFNSLFANNYSYGSSGGVGFCVGRFFNNTIAYNTATLVESSISGGAISLATESNPNLFVANTIIFGNNGIAIRDRDENGDKVNKVNPFLYCYIQSAVAQPHNATNKNVTNWTESATGNYGTGNTFLNGVAPSADNTPFAADFDENGDYVAGRAASLNDFRLRDDVPCVNKGTEEFAGEFYDALRHKNISDANIKKMYVYQSVLATVLPNNDVAFANRVQDCQIDIGAYEFNAAFRIRPDTTTHPGQAIYFVSYDSPGGDASSSAPENAACAQKLQQVLDAAGRYKYDLMTLAKYNKGTAGEYEAGQPNKHWRVEVWLQGNDDMSTESDSYSNPYSPTRSTKHSIPGYHDNTLDYSLIIPHGVRVKGGYQPGFFHYENPAGETVAPGEGHVVDDRDPLTWRTVISGFVTSSTGAYGQTFHVVTFTNDLFDSNENLYTDEEDHLITSQLAFMTDEKDRAVLDGIFIQDGYANSPDPEDQIGAGAVVTDFAHIRNCVIQDNQAMEKGGGLYLKPNALVSGTIIKRNTAKLGGGVYVEAPATLTTDSLAHIFSTTICQNTGTASAGGMWFDNTYVRVNSTVLWHNMASDNANVSGLFSRSDVNTDYPFNFCAVESRRLEGQGNLELSPTETEGVRWDRNDPFDAILYYPIEMSSTLARAGMTYNEWLKNMRTYTTLDSIDIAGVSRMRWISDGSERGFAWKNDTLVTKNNDMIEIGARAINKTFAINVDAKYVMKRLYVMHTDLINSVAARALQDNTLNNDTANMYRQMGSSILNPFHRPGDAFDYIIAARKSNPEKYRNTVFEVYIEAGTYYPYHNAYGEQDEVRNNTFLVPEGIYVIGGIDSRPEEHHYGQEGYYDMFTNQSYGSKDNVDVRVKLTDGTTSSYTIYSATLDEIRQRDATHRPMRDNNLNSVIEPWELERQTIFSGNAVSGEDFTHVYHVVTMHADPNYVGPQPIKYRDVNPDYGKVPSAPLLIHPIPMDQPEQFHEECDLSILARTTEFDGIQFTGGYANHLDPVDTIRHHYVEKTYFRGGGIFVDGNWTETFDDVDNKDIPNVTEPAKYNIPIVVENCFFTNNMAGNGGGLYSNGGIYMYGCRFTQNYSQGPMTALDQKFIPWTAGGCIATNAVCDVSNTLFDNNEARRGMWPINISGDEYIPDADARQGFGGCLSVAAQSRMRVVNCHFMKNKAVAYPSIYNFLANNNYSDPDSMQFAFNTIFWGNEVFEVEHLGDIYADDQAVPEESEKAFEEKYKGSRSGVFHYDPDEWDKYERLLHEYDSTYAYWTAASRKDTFNTAVTDKLAELREQGDKIEGLYFCSYRKTYGPTGMKPSAEGYLLTREEQRAFTDPRKKTVNLTDDKSKEDYTNLFSLVKGNNNVLINRLNTATDGPNFKQPTFVAGIDGYMQNADWLLARMNLTTDQGWGYLKQEVERGISYWITRYTGTARFETEDAAKDSLEALGYERDSLTNWSVFPVRGLPVANFKPDKDQDSPGAIYNFYSKYFGAFMSKVNAPLPLGDQYYMAYTRSTSDTETSGNMDRISKNPKFGVEDIYIDIGIYEYQYVQLDIKGQEIDTMWVATTAKDPLHQDGLSWETPTTDLQTAIDMLMASHNNHDKYICFLGDKEGTFSPSNVIDNRRAFIITSNTLAPIMPDSAASDYDYGVNSLNFLGGYSYDVKDAARNPQENPVVIEMPNTGSAAQRNQLFIIEDMTRQMVQVNWQGEYISRDSVVIPVTFDGITFINPYSTKGAVEEGLNNLGGLMSKKGGAAIYYRWQRRYEGGGGVWSPNFNMALHPDSALIDGNKVTLPKLTISNCIFMDNGERTSILEERSPAVRIDHGGGSSLIVNSLFHSNAGAAVYAKTFDPVEGENDLALVPNDVIIINCTSALNDRHIRLESDHSEVHNSLIWLDDLAHDTLTQLQMGTHVWDKNEHKNDEGIDGRMTYNAVWGCFQNHAGENDAGDTYKNHPLATDNNDIFRGPGFVQPNVHATTSVQRRERSFRLNPSVRTVNMADSMVYMERVFFRVYPDTCAATHSKYWRRSNGFKLRTITALANDSDLAAKPRRSGPGLDRGAYECLAQLQRVLYVQPDLAAFSAGDGSNWSKPFGQGQLQNAIDAAAVYTYLQQAVDKRESRKAYVFVKGSYESQEILNIQARDGVFVYGSLPRSFNDTAAMSNPTDKIFTDAECQRFVNYVRALSTGVASPNAATPTRINSIHIEGDDFRTGFLLDGFEITNANTRHDPVIIIDNVRSAVRNCVIKDNKVVDDGVPVAAINRGLLYNNLFYNDSASAIVTLYAGGLALNNTILTHHAGVTALNLTAATDGASQNNIATTDTANCFARYFTDRLPYATPAYLKESPILNFQLHEHSRLINAGTADNALPAQFNDYVNDSTIAFRYDRDILGNPRKIGTDVDMGALEAWYVAPKSLQTLTTITDKVGHDEPVDAHKLSAFLQNYGGNKYPHEGSVVYLMDSSAMSMCYESNEDFKDFGGANIVLSPGYVLLKSGASLFGNGHRVQLNYLAAEKRFTNQRYSMTAFPFNYNVANISVTHYNTSKDSLIIHASPFSFSTYQYNGVARSAKDYVFQSENSSLWIPIDTLNRTATDGYLMDFGEDVEDTVLRFTAFAAEQGRYVYQETGDPDKLVPLKRYDNREAGSGAALNFTRLEDMGWNMKGLPWLVSDYRTDTILNEGNFLRQMHIPHVFYRMDNAGAETRGDHVSTFRSWDAGTKLSMGNAFLVQTATRSDTEDIYFHLPIYSFNERVPRPIIRLVGARPVADGSPAGSPARNESVTEPTSIMDNLMIIPDSTADKRVEYAYGRDGVKWHMADDVASIYLLDHRFSSQLSLLGAAPTEVDIPLGISIPLANREPSTEYTFHLPEPEAFEGYGYVWLIDKYRNRFTNLLEQDYTVSLEPGTCNTRFAVRIGGFPLTDDKGNRQYIVYAFDGTLYVRGLIPGDDLAVYTATGQLLCKTISTGTEFTMPLFHQSGYVVRVNNTAHKVLNY
ncbi:MAG: right-handed parallel beta-helix repeat-containing protein [Paludibacteraceae bacterium]|nr:right-handed parallel beta-helix repeat-containing protein [Paludibacteraceae bacterium]